MRSGRIALYALLLILGDVWQIDAATYYVATTGSDARSCGTAQTITTPKQTIGSGVTCLSSGDTLSIRAGTYAEILEWFGWPGGTQGTSWATAITISAYANEAVTIKPGGSNRDYILVMRGSASGATDAPKYIIFNGITFDGSNVSGNYEIGVRAWDATTTPTADAPAHHIRFQNGRVTNGQAGQGFLVSWGSDGVEIINMEIDHNNGPTNVPNNTQGIYGAANDLLVERCHIHDNWGYGISNINSVPGLDNSRQTIRDNFVYNNGQGGTGLGGINLGEGTGNLIYNNVVYGNQGPGIILGFGNGSDGTIIYNNTVYNNTGIGIYIRPQDSNALIRNNISYLNAGGNYTDSSSGGTATEDHNLFTDPFFTNPGAGNFTLSAASVGAINLGTTTAYTTDIVGAVRPTGAAFDIGAYEYGAVADVDTPAGGTIFASDLFTGTAGTAWTSHSGEIGTTWTVQTGSSAGPVLSDADRLRSNSTPGNTFTYASVTPISNQYDVSADLVVFTQTTDSAFQLIGRASTGTATHYLGMYNLATGMFELEVAVAGSYTQLDQCTMTVTNGSTVRLRLELRDAIKKLYVNDVFCASSTDNSVTQVGHAGMGIYTPTTAGTNTTDIHMDRFVAQDVDTQLPVTVARQRLRWK